MVNHEEDQLSQPDQQGHQGPDKASEPRRTLEGRVSLETVGKYHVFLTDDCPENVRHVITALHTEQDVAKFITSLRKVMTPSRRNVYLSPGFFVAKSGETAPIFKQKAEKPNDPEYPGLKISSFTTDAFHEMETTYALQDILQKRAADVATSMTVDDEAYAVHYRVQKPWGAIVNSEDETQKYGIFEYINGISVRGEAAHFGLWNDIPEDLRVLYGQMHQVLDRLSRVCVEEGLEPWDLGIHQLIYTIDRATKSISLGIVDTEEFNFASDGQYWPDSFLKVGLPAILIYMMMFRTSDGYDD